MNAQIYGRKAKVCNETCREAFKEDKNNGVVYGPFATIKEDGAIVVIKTPEAASIRWKECVYCWTKVA